MLVTRQGINFGPNFILHPNTNGVWDYYSPYYKLTETPYSKDNVYIGIYEGDTIPQLPFDYDIESKTEEQVNALLLDWYGKDEEDNQLVYYTVGVVTDNRPNPLEVTE